jgi:hypothetical protein
VYLALGDSQGKACCQDFAGFLAQKLGRPVQIVNLAGDESAVDFIVGVGRQKPSQLDRAVAAIREYEAQGHPVVAITFSLGRKDYESQVSGCPSPADATCQAAFQSVFLRPLEEQLDLIYSRLGQSAVAIPVFSLGYFYEPSCPLTSDGVRSLEDVNLVLSQSAAAHSAFFIDLLDVESGCQLLAGSQPAEEGSEAIEDRVEAAYEALPPAFVDPFVRTETPPP